MRISATPRSSRASIRQLAWFGSCFGGQSSLVYTVGDALRVYNRPDGPRSVFRYNMIDGSGASSMATVTVTISGSNQAPQANTDTASAMENGAAVAIDVLANDTDPDLSDTKTVVHVNAMGIQGVATVAAGGTGVVYTVGNAFQTLSSGATATEVFSYTMRDSGGAESTAQVTVTVTGANDAPVAVANAATTAEDAAPIFIDVLANDTDVDVGDTRTVTSLSTTNLQGTVTIAPGGIGVEYAVGNAFPTTPSRRHRHSSLRLQRYLTLKALRRPPT